MRYLWTVFLGLAVLSGLSALTVDEAVKQAKDHNLGLQTEDLKLAQKTDEKNFASNRLYPTIDASTTLLRLNNLNLAQDEALWLGVTAASNHGTPVPFPSASYDKEDYHWIWSTGLKFQFILNPAVFRGITQTIIDYDNARISRDAAGARLDRDVRKTFYQLLALHEATKVFESQLKVADDRYRLAKLNAEAGLGSDIAALQSQVAFENRKPILADQKVNEDNALSAFRLLLNVPEATPLTLDGSLDVDPAVRKELSGLDVETVVKRYLDGRWDVEAIKGTSKSLENLAKLQADSLWPTLIFGFSMDPSVSAPFKSDTWSNPAYSKYNWSQTNGALSATLDWRLDSFIPGSTTQMQIKDRERQAQQARLGVEQTLRAGENEIRSIIGRLKKSAVSLEGLQLALSLAERSSKLTEDGYQAGTQSLTDAQDADLAYQTARLQYLNEELALQASLADLEYALAADRKEWLHG